MKLARKSKKTDRIYLDHKWVRAGASSNFDIYYICQKCGLMRHDTGWGPVKESYFRLGINNQFDAPSFCKKPSWLDRLISFFKGQSHAH